MQTEKLWATSRWLHRRGYGRCAQIVKGVNFALNGCLLPVEAVVGDGLRLEHHGMGVVIHPNCIIGEDVQIWHGVTVAAETLPGSSYRVRIGNGAMLGAGSVIVGRGDVDVVIGAGAKVGANAVVTRDVPAGATVVGAPARPV